MLRQAKIYPPRQAAAAADRTLRLVYCGLYIVPSNLAAAMHEMNYISSRTLQQLCNTAAAVHKLQYTLGNVICRVLWHMHCGSRNA